MTKLEIYNIALSQHGKKCLQTELDAAEKPSEVEACDLMYWIAVENALGEYDWSFATAPIELDLEDDEPHGEWAHGYAMPDGVLRLARVKPNHGPFLIANHRYYTNEDEPKVWAVMCDSKIMAYAPRDFCYLVGIWLGYLISTTISPSDGNLANRILQNYSAQLQSLMRRERNQEQENYLSEGEWGKVL